MADVITRLKVESSEYDSKIKRAAQSLNEMTTAAEREGNKIATANKENIALAQSLGKMATVSTTARGKMSELSSAIEAATIQYNRLTAAEKNGQFGKALNASITQLQGRLKTLSSEMAAAQAKISGAGIGAQFGAGLKSAFSMLGPTALAIGGVTAAIGGMKKAVGDMVRINMQFEQSSANLAAVMGKSRDEVTALTTQAKQLGATTQWTAIQILDLQTNLARLGFDQTEILNSTSAVQKLATATQADLGPAAELAGATLRAFGLNATEMERVTSVLAVSTTKSALSFDKLATALPIIAPVAKQAGFSLEDTVSMLGKLSDAGLDASMSANSLKNIFIRMANDSGKLAKALGGPVTDADSLAKALVKLRSEGMSLNDMFQMTGQRAVTAFGVLTEGAEDVAKLSTEITGCEDALDKMVKEQLETLEGQTKLFNSAWEGLMLSFSNSTGVISSVVGAFTSLLEAYTKWRNRRQGGDAAILSFQMKDDDVKKAAREQLKSLRDLTNADTGEKAFTDKQINANANEAIASLEAERDAAKDLYDQLQAINELKGKEHDKAQTEWNKQFKEMFKDYNVRTDGQAPAYLMRQIAGMNDQLGIQQYIADATKKPEKKKNKTTGGGVLQGDAQIKKLRAQYEAQEKETIAHLDREHMTEEAYDDKVYEIQKTTLESIAGLYNEDTKEYAQVMAKKSQLDIQYQATKMRLAQKAQRDEEQQRKKEEREKEAALRHQKQLDNTILRGLTGTAKRAGWNTQDLGVEGVKTKIDTGIDITEDEWTKFQDKLNERLMALGLDPIQINFETGNIEQVFDETKAQYQKFMDDLSSGVGAISTIGNAFNDLKGIGEDLSAAFSGEMDAWDALMTVFNSGIGIMETVIGIMEAINTLQNLGIALSGAKATAAGTEAAAVQTGAMTEVAAEGEKQLASEVTTGTNIMEATSGAGKAMSAIPIIGPILAVTAIAAVLGAILSAKSKASSAGKFAQGGIVPGNNYNDGLVANVSSGELILNRAQQESVARQLTAGDNRDGGSASNPYVTGDVILLGMNNYLGRSGQGEVVTTQMLRRAGINL